MHNRPAFAIALIAAAAAGLAGSPAQAAGCAGEPARGTVKLEIAATEVRNAKGEMAFTVYPDDRSRFLAHGGKLARLRVAAVAPVTHACFWLKPGYYGVAIYHDENGDHDFNRSLFSIKEGFGFSNDAPTTLGLPSFKSVRFLLPPSGASIAIRTRYSR